MTKAIFSRRPDRNSSVDYMEVIDQPMALKEFLLTLKAHYAHRGRPRQKGGSAPKHNSFSKSSVGMPTRSLNDAKAYASEKLNISEFVEKDGRFNVKGTNYFILKDGRVVKIEKERIVEELE